MNNNSGLKSMMKELKETFKFEKERESKYKGQVEKFFRARYKTMKDGREHICIEKGYDTEDVRNCLLQENVYDRTINNNDGYEVLEVRELKTNEEINEVIEEMVENDINNGLTREDSILSVTEVLECLGLIPDCEGKQ